MGSLRHVLRTSTHYGKALAVDVVIWFHHGTYYVVGALEQTPKSTQNYRLQPNKYKINTQFSMCG